MNHRTFPLLTVLVAFFMALGACKKDDFVEQTMDELDALAVEVSNTVTEAPDKKQGLADAQALLDGRKSDFSSKMGEIGTLRGFQVSDEAKQRMQSSLAKSLTKVGGLKLALSSQARKDPELRKAVDKLTGDFTEMVRP